MVNGEIELQILELAKLHLQMMKRISDAMEAMVSQSGPSQAPNYTLPLERWKGFDWASIGASVEQTDFHGVAAVVWRGQQFKRRAPSNKYDPAVWYSRCTGKDERGENQYERLITFKPLPQAEPVPERVSRLVI